MDKQWVLNCVEFIKKIEKNNYSWILSDEATNDNSAKLSCVSLFCKLAKIFENYHKFDMTKIHKIIKSYKTKENYYIDNRKKFETIIAETRQACSGLLNTNGKFDKVKLKKYYANKDKLYFMSDKNWNNPYSTGAQLSHYLFFLHYNNDTERIKDILKKLKKYQHKDGWYNNKPKDETKRINGIMKIFSGLDAINFDYITIKELVQTIIDSIIDLNPSAGGCNVYDYVYVLCKAITINYNVEKSREKLLEVYKLILTYQKKDGGFSYKPNQTQNKIYKTRIPQSKGPDKGGIHGTTLMCMALWMIDHACNLNLNLQSVKT